MDDISINSQVLLHTLEFRIDVYLLFIFYFFPFCMSYLGELFITEFPLHVYLLLDPVYALSFIRDAKVDGEFFLVFLPSIDV